MRKRVDWFRVITDLKRKQLTYREIGRRVGVNASTVLRWMTDVHEPKYSDGAALVALWCAETANVAEMLPEVAQTRPGPPASAAKYDVRGSRKARTS